MKLTTTALVALSLALVSPSIEARGSESALDGRAAVDTFLAGVRQDPESALLLFQDALQTNPGARRSLMTAAIEQTRADDATLQQIIYIARHEFPHEVTTLAEIALSSAPEQSAAIRQACFADAATMSASLAGLTGAETPGWKENTVDMDAEIREAMARMNARIEGTPWPEQELTEEQFVFKKRDDLRIGRDSREIDESSLNNTVPIDREEEVVVAASELQIRDRSDEDFALRLDESKFENRGKTAMRTPAMASQESIAPAGLFQEHAAIPTMPTLRQSSVYYIPPAGKPFGSTIDLEVAEDERPALVIRSAPDTRTIPE